VDLTPAIERALEQLEFARFAPNPDQMLDHVAVAQKLLLTALAIYEQNMTRVEFKD
jgi:hypothetical protein